MLEELYRIIDRHVQNLSDILLLVVDFQSFAIIAGAVADLTGHIDVRQEVHLNLDNPITRAGLTAAALDVKAETALLVAANLGFIGLGKQIANIVKDSSISSWIRARCPANRTLVDINQSIHVLNTVDFLELTWLSRVAVEFLSNSLFKDRVDQR